MTPSTRATILSIAREFAVISLFIVAAIVMTWPLLPQARTHIVDVGVDDTLLYTRYARCFRDWLLGREHGYLSFDMYFPSLLSGATDDAALGIGVQALPLALFIRDYLFTINLITFASFVMCAHATYLLARQLTASRGAGIVAGLAFAFCFYRMRQLEHPHVLQMQWLPYALYFLHRLAETPSRRNGILFTIFLFFACTASFNIAIYSAFVFPPITIWLILTTERSRFRFIGWLLFACGVVGASLVFIYKPFFILRDAGAPIRDVIEVQAFSSFVESFHSAPAFSKNYGDLAKNMTGESATFLGWVVLLLASVGLCGAFPIGTPWRVRPDRKWRLLPIGVAIALVMTASLVVLAFNAMLRVWAITLVVAIGAFVFTGHLLPPARHRASPAPIYALVALLYAALCFGPFVWSRTRYFGPGLWQQVQWLPGFEQVRTPSRLFFVSSLCAAILAGLGARAIADVLPGRVSRTLWYVAAAFLALWDVRSVSIPTRAMPTVATAPPIYEALAHAPKTGAVVDLPVEWNQRQREFVYYANIHERPTVNGLSGWGMYFFDATMRGAWLKHGRHGERILSDGLDAIKAEQIAGLRYAVIHGSWISEADRDLYADGLQSIGASRIGTYGTDELYELPDPPPSRPPTAADIELHFEPLLWREQFAREVSVPLRFVNRTSENLFENAMKHFTVIATADGEVVGRGSGYLLPPLFTPHGEFPANFRMKLVRHARLDWIDVSVIDDDGKRWGQMRMKVPD